MSLTLAQMASRVLRNCQIPEDSTLSSVQALADAKQYLNERANDVYSRRVFPEYIILGTYTIPANTRRFNLSDIVIDAGFTTSGRSYNATFFDIIAIREGVNPLLPEDPGAINSVQPDLWAATTAPVRFINRGQNGIFLLGQYPTATALSFFGKANFQDLTDGETWLLENEACLQAGATGDMLRDFSKDDNRAMIRYQEFEGEIAKIIDNIESQSANKKRIIPFHPWTRAMRLNRDFSRIGMNSTFRT